MLTTKQITAKVTSIGNRSKTLRADIHVVLCNIAGHVYEHGDWSQFPRLLSALKGYDQKAVLSWMKDNGFIRWTDKDGVLSFAVNDNAKKQADFANGAEVVDYLLDQTPWFESAQTTEQAVKALDPAQAIEALAKKIEKARANGREVSFSASSLRDAMIHLENVLRPQAVVGESKVA